jgi:hypothetical protein
VRSLVEGQFGMGVDVAAEGGDFRHKGRQQVVDHGEVRSGIARFRQS